MGEVLEVGGSGVGAIPVPPVPGPLETNLAHRHPIEVLVGKKNLETDEDIRALLFFSSAHTKATMEPPLSITLIDEDDTSSSSTTSISAEPKYKLVDLAIDREAVFITAVGHSRKCTLAS
ncbi:hypothetical protein HGRIS_004230 [Hohenbuehelia grisea]|uniref:Uncharacterized protein n=1 Tax=Hohenbuehelia grisea TaxID=104357 RepID=A0ABR3IP58_9AGAR